jgi:hypothetical protein
MSNLAKESLDDKSIHLGGVRDRFRHRPENQPDVMVLSLTTHKGVQDFAFSREQALLIAKTMKQTAAKLAAPEQRS